MKKIIITSIISGLLITIATIFIKFKYYDTEIGAYYHNGFPFKTYQMLGDAGIVNNYAFIGNLLFWTIILFLIILTVKKLKK